MTQPASDLVAANATLSQRINLSGLTVIAVMQGADGAAALLRAPSGEIARVIPGMQIFGIVINAIGDDQVVLTDATGAPFTMRVPGRD